MESSKPLTFGEQLVGISFNPSSLPDVDRVKTICAELADIVETNRRIPDQNTSMKELLFPGIMNSILEAQMNAVKYLTLKF